MLSTLVAFCSVAGGSVFRWGLDAEVENLNFHVRGTLSREAVCSLQREAADDWENTCYLGLGGPCNHMEAVWALAGQTHPRHFNGRKTSPWRGPAVTRLGEAVDLEMGRPRL